MESFLKKLGAKPSRGFVLDEHGEPDPQDLADEQEPFSANFSGTLDLSISEDENTKKSAALSGKLDVTTPHILLFEGGENSVNRVSFEVTSAEVIKEQRSSYVLYTILIASNCGIEKVPTTVERRYSDFEKLNTRLRKRFTHLMEDVSFPRKVLVGNFSSETIARRSRAFEQYLCHIYSVYEVRFSEDLADFFYLTDAREGAALLYSEQYTDAIPLFEKCLPVVEKLYGGCHPKFVSMLHALVVCYHANEKLSVAQKYAEVGLKCPSGTMSDSENAALIKLSIRLCWSLGKDKQDLELKLQELKSKKVDIEHVPDLKDIVRQQCLSMIE